MSYQKLEVWQLAKELTIEIHRMSLTLPDYEKFEEGQQIRRSIKTVRSTLVEGYGRRKYKADYIKFIVYALSSTDETIDHLDTLFETGSLKNKEQFLELKSKLEKLSKKLNNFLKAVQEKHETPAFINKVNEPIATYKNQESGIENQESAVNPWTTLSSEEKYNNRWINVTEYQVINPAGGKGIYGKIHFKNKAIGIIPYGENGNTWLVGQWRYPLNEWSWEIPEGGGPLDTDLLESAKRELKEETGILANRWTMIQRAHLSNSVSDEEGFIFLAEDLIQGESELEETEADLKVWKLPFTEALQMVLDGKITDSLSVMAILKVARMKGL